MVMEMGSHVILMMMTMMVYSKCNYMSDRNTDVNSAGMYVVTVECPI